MSPVKQLYLRSRHYLVYGASLAMLIFILKWLQWKFLIADNSIEIYVGLIAVFFTILGIWVARQLTRPRVQTVIVEKQVYLPQPAHNEIDHAALKKLNLTSREHDVLQLLVKGYSNAEIAAALFLSVSTIKTHASNLFVKMDVKSRTQAIEKAKRLNIID